MEIVLPLYAFPFSTRFVSSSVFIFVTPSRRTYISKGGDVRSYRPVRVGHLRRSRLVLHPAQPVQRAPGLLRVSARVSHDRAAACIGIGDVGGVVVAAARFPVVSLGEDHFFPR